MKHILVCEDEAAIRAFVVVNLKRAGFTVTEAASGEEALQKYMDASTPIDVALLDVMLPRMDGFAVCKALRTRDAVLGIIMLTARSQETEKVEGLQCGADDYITKPFSPTELIARVEALYRRVEYVRGQTVNTEPKKLECGEFTLDFLTRTLRFDGKEIELTHIEFQLLELFFTQPGVCHKRDAILQRIWGDGYHGEEKVVDVNLRRLRKKIEKDPSSPRHLLTEWGKGYKWAN